MAPNLHSEETLFARAVALPVNERAAFLEAACGGDAALREAVENLLRGHDNGGSFMAESAIAGAPDLAALLPGNETAEDTRAQRLGRYKLLQKIGEGGCGVVYMAEQEEPVRRRVALKVIKLGMDTREVIARFEAERQALAMMDHPNIARVLDAGETEAGRPYFVMELVRGVKITDYCDQHQLSTAERLKLFAQVCHAVQHAHQKGIIHRDIKPSNILVTLHDGTPLPKVIDFGIAKATQGRLTDRTLFTAFEQFIGTPAYMSPEQAEMSSLDIDTRSDVYSLGVLLYELLTGRTPFEAKALLRAGLDEMRRQIREVEPPRPSTRLRTLDKDTLTATAQHRHSDPPKLINLISGDLDWIVMRCLEKDRTRRYESAASLAQDLQRHLDNEPVAARPASGAYRFRKMVRRHRIVFGAAAAVFVTLISGIAASLWQAVRAQRAEQNARNEAAIAEAVNSFLNNDLLSQAGGWAQADFGFAPKPDLTVREALDRAVKRLDGRFATMPLVEAAIRQTIGTVYYEISELELSMPHLERAYQLRKKLLGADHVSTLASMDMLAWGCVNVARGARDGLMARAVELGEEVVRRRKVVIGPDHRDTLNSMYYLAFAYRNVGRRDDERAMIEEAARRSRTALGPNDAVNLKNQMRLASSLRQDGKLDEALALGQETLKTMRSGLGDDHPYTLKAMRSVAFHYIAHNRRSEALALREESLRRSRRTLGDDDFDTLTSMHDVADSYRDSGRLAEAIALYEEAIRRSKMKDHPNTVAVMRSLAQTHGRMRDFASAERGFRELIELQQRAHGVDSIKTAEAKVDLARNLNAQLKQGEAEPLLRDALAIRLKETPDHWTTFMTQCMLGAALSIQRKYAEAEPLLLAGYKGLKEQEKRLDADGRNSLTNAMQQLVRHYTGTGEHDKADDWRTKASSSKSSAVSPR